MSDMKCPICNRNLHKGEDGIYSHLDYMTECKGRLFDGSKELWQELIRTHKKLETLQEFVTKLYLNGDITDEQLERYKKMLTTALEQKE